MNIVTQNVGPNRGQQRRRAYFTPTAAGTYYLAVGPGHTGRGGVSGSVESAQNVPTYGVRVRKADDYAASTSTTARVVGGSARGHFFASHGGVTDTDWIRVDLTVGTRYRFTLTVHATAITQAKIVGVYNSSGTKVAGGANAHGYSAVAESWFTPTATGDYYVAVQKSHRKAGDGTGGRPPWVTTPDYTLTVTED